jgi:hypothetical protein
VELRDHYQTENLYVAVFEWAEGENLGKHFLKDLT